MKKIALVLSIIMCCMLYTGCLADDGKCNEIFEEYESFMNGSWKSTTLSDSMLKQVYGSGLKGEFTFSSNKLFVDASGQAYYDMEGPIVRILINPENDRLLLIWGDTVSISYARSN